MFSLECGDPPEIEDAYPYYSNTSIVEYKCYEQYYKLIGDPVINCLENGSWATQNFTCKEVLTKMHPWDLKRPTDKNENTTKMFKFLNQCYARLRFWKSVSSKTAVAPLSRFCESETLFQNPSEVKH